MDSIKSQLEPNKLILKFAHIQNSQDNFEIPKVGKLTLSDFQI